MVSLMLTANSRLPNTPQEKSLMNQKMVVTLLNPKKTEETLNNLALLDQDHVPNPFPPVPNNKLYVHTILNSSLRLPVLMFPLLQLHTVLVPVLMHLTNLQLHKPLVTKFHVLLQLPMMTLLNPLRMSLVTFPIAKVLLKKIP